MQIPLKHHSLQKAWKIWIWHSFCFEEKAILCLSVTNWRYYDKDDRRPRKDLQNQRKSDLEVAKFSKMQSDQEEIYKIKENQT